MIAQDRGLTNQAISTLSASNEHRVALVIGNSSYTKSPLKNAVNDANLMTSTLQNLGFDVMKYTNLSQKDMKRAFTSFGDKLKPHSVALVFYAGHGIEVNKNNYMIPVDAIIEKEADVRVEGVAIDDLFEQMQLSGCTKNMLILDACRDNPFLAQRSGGSRTIGKLSATFDIKIIYATTPGNTASDGYGTNGTFTKALVDQLNIPNQELVDVLINTSEVVKKVSNGAQKPYEEGTNFRFVFNQKEVKKDTTAILDSDGDGVVDRLDKCPREYGDIKNEGCPLSLQTKVDANLANEWNNKGEDYLHGRNGVVQNYTEAEKWYRKSAEQGNSFAQHNLGYLYQHGYGVVQDYSEAEKWYRKSAEQGNAAGQCNLGYMYLYGYGVKQDYTESAKWFRKSAEQDDANGQCSLGYMCQNGYGLPQNYTEAIKWYRKSAEQSNATGQFNLGDIYLYGYGVKQDYTEAVKWYRKSAEQGYRDAKARLKALGYDE